MQGGNADAFGVQMTGSEAVLTAGSLTSTAVGGAGGEGRMVVPLDVIMLAIKAVTVVTAAMVVTQPLMLLMLITAKYS